MNINLTSNCEYCLNRDICKFYGNPISTFNDIKKIEGITARQGITINISCEHFRPEPKIRLR